MIDFDPATPSIARVYDFLLGGKGNFAVDREIAAKLLAVAPDSADVMSENRQFLARAARWAAGQGLTQFVDPGCGMPTLPNTHRSVQSVAGDAHVAYVDLDAVVLAHLRALAAISAGIDLRQPCCLIMGALLHFFPADAARELVAACVAALAPGSYLALSVGRADGERESQGFSAYSAGGVQVYNHSVADFAGFFG